MISCSNSGIARPCTGNSFNGTRRNSTGDWFSRPTVPLSRKHSEYRPLPTIFGGPKIVDAQEDFVLLWFAESLCVFWVWLSSRTPEFYLGPCRPPLAGVGGSKVLGCLINESSSWRAWRVGFGIFRCSNMVGQRFKGVINNDSGLDYCSMGWVGPGHGLCQPTDKSRDKQHVLRCLKRSKKSMYWKYVS